MVHTVSCEIGGKKITLETGKIARQAGGSVLVSFGDTRVLVTACCAPEPKEDLDFFPLTVEYAERFYAAGKIPGSFFKREGRPTTDATLAARMIDRPIRPLFPEGFRNETQIVATILSLDNNGDPEVAAAIGTGAALHLSDIPFNGPTACCKVGRIAGELVLNPSWEQLKSPECDMEIVVSGTENAVMMIEGGAKEATEEDVLQAILKGHEAIKEICRTIEDFRKKCGQPKREFVPYEINAQIKSAVEAQSKSALQQVLATRVKSERYDSAKKAKKAMLEALLPESEKTADPAKAKKKEKELKAAFEDLHYRMMRDMILDTGGRIDGRDTKTIRPISTEVGILPRAHGSSLFTRGETQVLATITLGTKLDEQIIDSLYENGYNKYLFHYNFPPFSVGEVGRMGGQSRREIGHGALAGRSIQALAPPHEKFPYTLRIVCETLESNGSSSMGSVCSASMALMDAGVPFPKPVAGIAMGLIKENERVAILSDILGDEDHLGDMDFKVAGTDAGITGIQMDIKIEGVNEKIMRTALEQAREGRLHILGEMAKSITASRGDLSKHAPRIISMQIPVDKIAAVIGPGGKVIKEIIATTGCTVDINDSGIVNIGSTDDEAAKKAVSMIENLVAEVELGKTYKGTVRKITDFGAFVSVLPKQDGLLHISEIAHERVRNVTDYLKEGDEVEVKVIEIDPTGRIRLSRKELLPPPEGGSRPPSGGPTGDRGGQGGGGGRGPRPQGGPRGNGPRGEGGRRPGSPPRG